MLAVIGKQLVVRYEALGLVGVIGPWNYPLTNSFGDCIPALAAGNSVILKPSEVTPLTSLLMAEALEECGLPRDVYQVATGLGDVGGALVDEVDFVMFTGSTETGKKVAEQAAKTLTPVGLELGGKDPMIVLRDADVPVPLRDIAIPQRFHEHGTRAEVLASIGLTAQDVARKVTEWASGTLGEVDRSAVPAEPDQR